MKHLQISYLEKKKFANRTCSVNCYRETFISYTCGCFNPSKNYANVHAVLKSIHVLVPKLKPKVKDEKLDIVSFNCFIFVHDTVAQSLAKSQEGGLDVADIE